MVYLLEVGIFPMNVPACQFELVCCTSEYWEFVRLLRIDKRVSDGFIQQSDITAEEQSVYMNRHSSNYRIALSNGVPCGFIGVIDDDIRVCTHPDFQSQGVGLFMVGEIIKIYPNAVAKIKVGNSASRALFKAAGFQKAYEIFHPPTTTKKVSQ